MALRVSPTRLSSSLFQLEVVLRIKCLQMLDMISLICGTSMLCTANGLARHLSIEHSLNLEVLRGVTLSVLRGSHLVD